MSIRKERARILVDAKILALCLQIAHRPKWHAASVPPRAGNEVHPLGTLQRKGVPIAQRDVEQERWRRPAFVLLSIDIERALLDFPKQQVVGAKQQITLLQAHRGAAITAAP